MVEPLTSQMADYLGVPSGIMIKQVASKSQAASAGLKAFDVILKVGPEPISTLADWDRSLRSNQGKPVQVTILRDRKQQTLTLQVDSKRHGQLQLEELFPSTGSPLVADLAIGLVPQLDPDFADQLRAETQSTADQLRQQAEALRDRIKADDFKLDQSQLDQIRQQMEEFRKTFNPEDFKLTPQQLQQFHHQMDELKRQLQELKSQGIPGHA